MSRKESLTGATKRCGKMNHACIGPRKATSTSMYPNYAADLLTRKLATDIIAVFLERFPINVLLSASWYLLFCYRWA
jgi:hypothetical protein